jgi:hypothetical protein
MITREQLAHLALDTLAAIKRAETRGDQRSILNARDLRSELGYQSRVITTKDLIPLGDGHDGMPEHRKGPVRHKVGRRTGPKAGPGRSPAAESVGPAKGRTGRS